MDYTLSHILNMTSNPSDHIVTSPLPLVLLNLGISLSFLLFLENMKPINTFHPSEK